MAEPRVSVIMPAYKCAGIIGKALESLVRQTRPPDEIIVVDDGSPDDVAGAVKAYADWVRYLRKENGGASSARNAGLDVSTGDLIAFLDSDDWWHPAKLADQLAVFERYPEVGLVSSRFHIQHADGTGEDVPPLAGAPWNQVLRLRGELAFECSMLVWTSAVIFRRQTLGSERFDVTLKTAEDRDLWVRLVTRTPIYLQSDVLATLLEVPGSLSRSDLDMDCSCMLRMIHKHRDALGTLGLKRQEAEVYRRWAGSHLGAGRGKQALRPAVRRLSYQPLSPEGWWVLAKSSAAALGNALF